MIRAFGGVLPQDGAGTQRRAARRFALGRGFRLHLRDDFRDALDAPLPLTSPLRYTSGMPIDYSDYIVQDPQICGGEPVVRSTRVTVRTVLASLAEGATVQEILEDFPSLSEESVRAVIAFAAASASEDLPLRAVPAFH